VKRFVASICEKGVAKNTVRLAIASLRPLLNAAIEDGIIQSNPATRLGRFVQTEKPERRSSSLTREETKAFLKSSLENRPRFYPLFLTALRAGLRLSELLALT
jgi:integrase